VSLILKAKHKQQQKCKEEAKETVDTPTEVSLGRAKSLDSFV
jgi:hypothetical protein